MDVRECVGILVKSVAQSIPVAQNLVTAWSEYENIKTKERLEYFFKILENEIKINESRYLEVKDKIYENKYTVNYLESISRNVIREASSEKQGLYGKLLFNSLIFVDTKDEDKLDSIQILDSLYEQDIDVLKVFLNTG